MCLAKALEYSSFSTESKQLGHGVGFRDLMPILQHKAQHYRVHAFFPN